MVFKRVADQDDLDLTRLETKLGWGLSISPDFISRVQIPRKYLQLGFGNNFFVNCFSPLLSISLSVLTYRSLKSYAGKRYASPRQYELSYLRFLVSYIHGLIVKLLEGNSLLIFSSVLLQVLYFECQIVFDLFGLASMVLFLLWCGFLQARAYRLIN